MDPRFTRNKTQMRLCEIMRIRLSHSCPGFFFSFSFFACAFRDRLSFYFFFHPAGATPSGAFSRGPVLVRERGKGGGSTEMVSPGSDREMRPHAGRRAAEGRTAQMVRRTRSTFPSFLFSLSRRAELAVGRAGSRPSTCSVRSLSQRKPPLPT